MLGFILGTSDGKNLLKDLNKYTDDLFLSVSTEYGGELLSDIKCKVLNTKPLDKEGLICAIRENNINVLVDFSHPYAVNVSKNAMEACSACNIEYIRFQRESAIEGYKDEPLIHMIKDLDDFKEKIKNKSGNILNATGVNRVSDLINMNLENRIIHRILPTKASVEKAIDGGAKIDDIIAIKGPISYELDLAFLKNYDIKIFLFKDSGKKGATEEKIKSALELNIHCFIIEREKTDNNNIFYNEEDIFQYIKEKYIN
ncbi:MAG: cobalt-precorrin-6A reductase [Clostridium perfringens]|nr:cobalt-precorrin-6A reductase [Clostridium perfringens]